MNNIKYPNSILFSLTVSSIIPFLIWGHFFPDLIVSILAIWFFYFIHLKIKNFTFLITNL